LWFAFISFPCHDPSMRIASPFFAILMSGVSIFPLKHRRFIISFLYSSLPIGITSVFSSLNLAVEASQNIFIHLSRVSGLSVAHRYIVVSSA
jgi:hypothetical protein